MNRRAPIEHVETARRLRHDLSTYQGRIAIAMAELEKMMETSRKAMDESEKLLSSLPVDLYD